MKLHEYQSKQLFQDYQIPTPQGSLVESTEAAVEAAQRLGGDSWVVKAQVHSRGRGPAGGVCIVRSIDELRRICEDLLNRSLITKQTGPAGQPIRRLLIEQVVDIRQELYLAMLIDRSLDRIVVVASVYGGVDIEELSIEKPESVHTVAADLVLGLLPNHARRLALKLGLDKRQETELAQIIYKLYRLFRDKDLVLLEINPIAVNHKGELVALDAKLVVDDNALHRHEYLSEIRDVEQEDERENFAEQHGLHYVSLKGNIGCIVNGAGLAMATTDLLKLHGGEPANFLDLGGRLDEDTVIEAVRLILSASNITGILVNIFGGIVQCDVVARGLVRAVAELHVELPVVVRFSGTFSEEACTLLRGSPFKFDIKDDFVESVRAIVQYTQV
ncbi:MAG: ADP-forming succinate--CoA ligase subunit beta [Gammaproteobacteria bacterium]|nr:ADP-forming succinate--CoA ligase subunit beta [Gammaproteobacteria bacterium]